MEKKTKKPITVRLTPKTIKNLKSLCRGWGVSQGWLIGDLIDQCYKDGVKEGRKLKAIKT